MNETDLLEIFRDINEIKHKEREGWINRGIEQPRDTIASHTFGATIIGWILSEKEEFDTEKVIKMLLLHDLIMAYLPDYAPKDEEFESKKELEEERLEKLVEDVPDTVEQEFEELLAEMQNQETDIARFAKECDKIETLLQALIYSEENDENYLPEFLESYEDYFETPTGKEIFQQINQYSRDID